MPSMRAGAPTRKIRRARSARRSGATEAAFSGLLGIVGCARLPGVPAGPITGPAVRLSTAVAYTHVPATVEIHEPEGEPRAFDANTGVHDGPWLPIPLRLAGRVSLARWMDIGGDVGWVEKGLQLRAGPLDARRSLPWGVELEWRTEDSSSDDDATLHGHTYRARFEAYPALPLGSSQPGLPHAFGVVTAGISSGTRLLSPLMPPRFDRNGESTIGIPLTALRRETRLELGLGLHWLSLPTFFTVMLMPWVGLDRGNLRGVSCENCTPLELDRMDGSWGLSIALSSGVVLGPQP